MRAIASAIYHHCWELVAQCLRATVRLGIDRMMRCLPAAPAAWKSGSAVQHFDGRLYLSG